MTNIVDFTQQKTSWTKYDIVRVMEVIQNLQTLQKYLNKEAKINEPILKSFLGIKSLEEPLPEHWTAIQNFPSEKKLFALFAIIFTHGDIVKAFAEKYSRGAMRGKFFIDTGDKVETNIRSALIEAGASETVFRREKEVPFDFSPIFLNAEVGKLFKLLLLERLTRLKNFVPTSPDFYEICYSNQFHKALSLTEGEFKTWLEGGAVFKNSFIKAVDISDFFAIDKVQLSFDGSKEIYFLGENGDGKSLLLMAIYIAFNGCFITEKADQEKVGKASDIIRETRNSLLKGTDSFDKTYNPRSGTYLNNIYAYGVHRGRYSTDDPEEYGFMSLFDNNQTLTNPESWLKDLYSLKLQNESANSNPKTASDFPISIDAFEKMIFDLLERNVEIQFELTKVNFIEKGQKLKFEQLSEGYKSILIFVSDLIFRLIRRSKNRADIFKSKGIVLVDEIDLHLHPKWQRVIVQKLRTLFPAIQFIFTTHSPTIIQGASEDSIIYRVFRDPSSGKTHISDPYLRKDLDHLMINTLITSPLFGLTDSRLNTDNGDSDTSETYLLYKLNKKLEELVKKQKSEGKNFISDEEIDTLIQKIIAKEFPPK